MLRLQSSRESFLSAQIMKPKCFLLLIVLGVSRPNLAASSIDEAKVKSYVVQRRPITAQGNIQSDLFTVNMKDGQQCTTTGVDVWCKSLSASYSQLSWNNRSSCSCTCNYDFPSFLPSNQTCIKGPVTTNFGGKHSGILETRPFHL